MLNPYPDPTQGPNPNPKTLTLTLTLTLNPNPNQPETHHKTLASVVAARKTDLSGPLEACVVCGGSGSDVLCCYSCETVVHVGCVWRLRDALCAWADPVRLHEHFSGHEGGDGHLVCPQCFNDYHDAARVSKFCDKGYLSAQGCVSMWDADDV